jgi:hypothetical protein
MVFSQGKLDMPYESPFHVRPLRRYRKARYGSETPENLTAWACWLSWQYPRKAAKGAAVLLCAAALVLGGGAIGCNNDKIHVGNADRDAVETELVRERDDGEMELEGSKETEVDSDPDPHEYWGPEGADVAELIHEPDLEEWGEPEPDRAEDTSSDPEPDMEPYTSDVDPNDLEESETYGPIACIDNKTARVARSNGMEETVSCLDYCREELENQIIREHEMVSLAWCDPEAEDPCQCMYDALPGSMHYCLPGEWFCSDDDTVLYCTYSENFHGLSCREFCIAFYSLNHEPTGCDETNPINACGCTDPDGDGDEVDPEGLIERPEGS